MISYNYNFRNNFHSDFRQMSFDWEQMVCAFVSKKPTKKLCSNMLSKKLI